MSVSQLLKDPPDSWTNLYVNSINAAGATATFGDINCHNLSATGTISGPVANINSIHCGSLGATGTSALNTVTCNTLSATGSISCILTGSDTAISCSKLGISGGTGGSTLPSLYASSSVTNTGIAPALTACDFLLQDLTTGFSNNTGCLLCLDAPNSVSLSNGTSFLVCHNLAATGPAPGTGSYTNGIVAKIQSDGTMNAPAFTIWSSEEYKKNIDKLNIDSKLLRNISPCTYHYNIQSNDDPKRAGILYEDLLKICPEACDINEKGVNIGSMCGVLFSINKHLEERLSLLEDRLHKILTL